MEPKEPIIDENSNLHLGDKLGGDQLELIVDDKKRLKQEHIGGHTGKHGSRVISTEKFTYARITRKYYTIPFKLSEQNS